MSEIIKTQAIVLRKIDYGETSKIAQFYTEDFGKISAIIKGARSPKSKTGMMIDTMNLLQIVLYKKETREVQVVSDVDLVKHFSKIRDDYEKYNFGLAVLELLSVLTLENEHNNKLFEGTAKILALMDDDKADAKFLFAKYFLFFLKEIGYEFQTGRCGICGKGLAEEKKALYNYESGLMCADCGTERLTNFNLTEELFNLLLCLTSKNNIVHYTQNSLDYIIKMLEKFLMYNVHEFKGIKSIKI